MKTVTMEHNLMDYELEDTLEKALGEVRTKIQRPERRFRQPAMETISKRVQLQAGDEMRRMLKRIEAVIKG